MSDLARVDSIDALSDFRAALWKFAETATVALGEAESDLQRTLMWLETEQTSVWQGQIRKRQEILSRANEALREKRIFKDASGRTPSAVDEEKAVKVAKQRLMEAEEKLVAVRKYVRVLQKAMHDYKGSVQGFATAVASDIPNAVARLDKLAGTLREYVNLNPVGVASDEEKMTPRPDAIHDGETMGRKLAEAMPAAAEFDELPDFPTFTDPQVALVHTHVPTGLILSAEGDKPADEAQPGSQYRRFGSAAEAEAYAAGKVRADADVECAIYGADRRRLKVVRAGG